MAMGLFLVIFGVPKVMKLGTPGASQFPHQCNHIAGNANARGRVATNPQFQLDTSERDKFSSRIALNPNFHTRSFKRGPVSCCPSK